MIQTQLLRTFIVFVPSTGRSYTKLYGIRAFDKAGHPVDDGRAIVCFFLVVPCVVVNHITGQIADSFILEKE